jgi:hypothetical protein
MVEQLGKSLQRDGKSAERYGKRRATELLGTLIIEAEE